MTTSTAFVATQTGFVLQNLPLAPLQPTDLLINVTGTALNPIDLKRHEAAGTSPTPLVLGYDAVGAVSETGATVSDFTVGDRVIYSGTTTRPGSLQSAQLVDARLVAKLPAEISDADAVALPLVGLTAWELLFEKLGFTPATNANSGKRLLVINGAGGVGSLLTQLAHWAGLTVLATASPAHHDWLRAHGVDLPVDYHDDLVAAVKKSGIETVDAVAILYAPAPYLPAASALVAPFGQVATLVTPNAPLDITALKAKSASFAFEYMFTKTDFAHDIASQGAILQRLVALMADGVIGTSVTTHLQPRSLANLTNAVAQLAAGHQVGKIVLTGPVTA